MILECKTTKLLTRKLLCKISNFSRFLGLFSDVETWPGEKKPPYLLFSATIRDSAEIINVRYEQSIHRDILSEEDQKTLLSCQKLLIREDWLKCVSKGFLFQFYTAPIALQYAPERTTFALA